VLATLFANVAIDRVQQTLDISDLELKVDNLTLTASIKGRQIIDAPEFNGAIQVAEFNLATLLANMAMPLPEMQDSSVMRKVSTHFSFQASKDTVKINDWFVQLDDTHLQGHGSISHFEKPDINFDLTVDTIDLDRYMAATSAANNAGQADTKAASQHHDMKAVSTSAIAAVAVTTLFPVETLRAINAQGKISIEKLKVNQLNMSGLHFKLNAKNGTISTQQTVKHFYQGSYSGATSIDVHGKTPKITLNHQLRKVQIAPLLKDTLDEAKVTGVVNAAINLKGRGNTEAALKSSLNGHIDFNVKDGVVKGFNLQKIIDQGKALIVGGVLSTTNKNDQTVFSVLKGSAQITNGLVSNEDLYVEASKLRVKGAGTVNLVSEEIDYSINARLLKKPATETEDEKIKGIPITINVGGTFSNPAYSVDMIAMLTAKNKEKINKKKDEWLKKLDKKLGPDVRDLIKGFF
jgi:AsmA protein